MVHIGISVRRWGMINFISTKSYLPPSTMQYYCLIDTLERRDSFALVLVQGRADDATILELDFGAGRVVLE